MCHSGSPAQASDYIQLQAVWPGDSTLTRGLCLGETLVKSCSHKRSGEPPKPEKTREREKKEGSEGESSVKW